MKFPTKMLALCKAPPEVRLKYTQQQVITNCFSNKRVDAKHSAGGGGGGASDCVDIMAMIPKRDNNDDYYGKANTQWALKTIVALPIPNIDVTIKLCRISPSKILQARSTNYICSRMRKLLLRFRQLNTPKKANGANIPAN